MISYSPGQLMSALGLSKQQWRTFKRALSQLETGRGHAACLKAGDLLAASVSKRVSDTLRMPVSQLTPLSDTLFRVCSSAPWPQLERSSLILWFEPPRVELITSDTFFAKSGVSICVELRPIITALRENLLDVDTEDQRQLAFPPVVAAARP